MKQRDETALRGLLTDPSLLEVIDTKALILDKILKTLKLLSMNSVLAYLKSLLRDFILAYLIFAVLLTLTLIALLIWSLTVVKRGMWDTNIILKILPFETIPREQREEIKQFFQQ
jgi:hypothetical protein